MSEGISPRGDAPAGNERMLKLPARVVVSLRAGAVLAVANVLCVVILCWAWVHVHHEAKTLSVTGSAKKVIMSDLIVWDGRVSAQDPDLKKAYDQLETGVTQTLAFLKQQGITDKEITVGPVSTTKHHEKTDKGIDTDRISSYELSQTVEISSTDVPRVGAVARKVTELIQQGIMLDSGAPSYFYTKMADLKIVMLAQATKDATARAQQIATNSNAALGPIIDARMGVMQINALHSDDVSGSGVNDTSSLQKEITAVVSATFKLQ